MRDRAALTAAFEDANTASVVYVARPLPVAAPSRIKLRFDGSAAQAGEAPIAWQGLATIRHEPKAIT